MLSTDDVIQHFAARLVYAIESGSTRAALDIYREWRVHVATFAPQHGLTRELHARMREIIDGAAD